MHGAPTLSVAERTDIWQPQRGRITALHGPRFGLGRGRNGRHLDLQLYVARTGRPARSKTSMLCSKGKVPEISGFKSILPGAISSIARAWIFAQRKTVSIGASFTQ